MGDPGDKTLKDKFVLCQKGNVCCGCSSRFEMGTVVRVIVKKFQNDGLRSYRFCKLCCDAQASSWSDGGFALEARERIRRVI